MINCRYLILFLFFLVCTLLFDIIISILAKNCQEILLHIEIYFYLRKGVDSVGKKNGKKKRKMSLRTVFYDLMFVWLAFVISD